MKKFQFNLSTLLQVRNEALNAAHRDLQEAHIHLKNMLKKIEELEREYILLTEDIQRKQKEKFFASELADQHDYLIRLELRIKLQVEEVVKAQINVEDRRLLIVQAMQRKKTIENLRDKQYTAWETKAIIAEAVFFDEVSSIYHRRRSRQ